MEDYYTWQENRIKRRDAEIDLLWNALRDIYYNSQSHEEAKKIAIAAADKLDPFAPVEVVQALEEARKAS